MLYVGRVAIIAALSVNLTAVIPSDFRGRPQSTYARGELGPSVRLWVRRALMSSSGSRRRRRSVSGGGGIGVVPPVFGARLIVRLRH
jgi:hypothetical protein